MRKFFAVLTLFFLSPFIAEFLLGATPLSNIGGMILIAPLYGGGAVLIRELIRRRNLNWTSIVLLGAAYALVEEGLAIQSLFNPNLFNAAAYGGRALGVNWVWSLWTVAYHSVVSISIPILLAELLFKAERNQPWTSTVGLIAVGILYLVGAAGIGAIYRFVVAPGFTASPPLLITTAVLVILLAILALNRSTTLYEQRRNVSSGTVEMIPSTGQAHPVPSPWWVSILTFLAFGALLMLFNLPQALRQFPLTFIPILIYIALSAAAYLLFRRWTAPHTRWDDRHSLAIVIGVLLVVMLDGFFFVVPGVGTPLDRIVQGIASLITLIMLAGFAAQVSRRPLAQAGAESMD